jgi:hypothetical protein
MDAGAAARSRRQPHHAGDAARPALPAGMIALEERHPRYGALQQNAADGAARRR